MANTSENPTKTILSSLHCHREIMLSHTSAALGVSHSRMYGNVEVNHLTIAPHHTHYINPQSRSLETGPIVEMQLIADIPPNAYHPNSAANYEITSSYIFLHNTSENQGTKTQQKKSAKG